MVMASDTWKWALRALTLTAAGLLFWLLGLGLLGAAGQARDSEVTRTSPTPLAAATPLALLPTATQLQEEAPPTQLVTRKPPPRPAPPRRQILKVNPPPPAPETPTIPQLPGAGYPQVRQAQPPAYPVQPVLASQTPPTARLNPQDYIRRAESSSAQIDRLIRQGKLRAQFVGTGQAGEMVEMVLENTGNQPLQVRLVPGMILRPPEGQKVQPLMLDEEVTLTLQPGNQAYRRLRSYCMDSRVPAHFAFEPIDYRFSSRTREGGPETVKVFQAAQQIALNSPLPEELHRRAVTQIALWKSMGQPVDDTRLRSAMGEVFYDLELRRRILADVQRVLRQARQNNLP